MVLEKTLEARNVPPIPAFKKEEWPALREAYKNLLLTEEYGMPVPEPTELTFEEGTMMDPVEFASGYAVRYPVKVHTVVNGRPFDFEFHACIPVGDGPHPFFVHNDFDEGEPVRFLPIEEIVQQGFAVLHVHYKAVTSDDDDFTNGVAGCLYPNGASDRGPTDPGKIMMWAWANMRLMDYAMTCPFLDCKNAAVIGHSRLGKTALVTGMLDERFRYVVGNNSGCSGDAITRHKNGERVHHILHAWRWFCENYKKYSRNEKELPFDQHMLLATIAPRTLLLGAAHEDTWADPYSQYLGAVAASTVWEQLGMKGFIHPDRLPEIGDTFDEGDICYHLRWGKHFLGRLDWNQYIKIIRRVMANDEK